MTCPRVLPPARYSLTCECEDCTLLRKQHRAACVATLRKHFPPPPPKPVLTDCPRAKPGTRYARGCACDLCYEERAKMCRRANEAKLTTEVDEVVIQRIIADPVLTVKPTVVERKLAALELRKRGRGAHAIAKKVGVTPRTVERYFQKEGITVLKLRGDKLRQIVKERVLEDPIISFRELAKEAGALPTTLSMHHAALVASGELPARDNLRTRNKRNGH